MLKPEDCKPGVEVISLGNTSSKFLKFYDYPNGLRKKYKIYTIKEFVPQFKFSTGPYDCVFLHELTSINKFHNESFPFLIEYFKLIDPKKLDQFYDLVKKPVLENAKITA